jgi:hypothetical protein
VKQHSRGIYTQGDGSDGVLGQAERDRPALISILTACLGDNGAIDGVEQGF